jgi:hypothetical protein
MDVTATIPKHEIKHDMTFTGENEDPPFSQS